MHLLISREQQLSDLAEAADHLLEEEDTLETQLERKTRENEQCIRAQQTAQHELRLCSVTFP